MNFSCGSSGFSRNTTFCNERNHHHKSLNLTAEVQVQYQASPSGIYSGQSDSRTGYSPTISVFPAIIVPPKVHTHSSIPKRYIISAIDSVVPKRARIHTHTHTHKPLNNHSLCVLIVLPICCNLDLFVPCVKFFYISRKNATSLPIDSTWRDAFQGYMLQLLL